MMKVLTRCMFLAFGLVLVQIVVAQTTVEGVVTDAATGEPLSGATVNLGGTSDGVTTNEQGRFVIQVPSGINSLRFSYVGYQTQSANLRGRTRIDVAMVMDEGSIDEVVVVGYGTVRKSDLTGSVTTLSQKDFNQGAITSADQLIAGKAAGVQVVQNSGEPGGGISVNIRGVGSINAGNSPLYVVDGLPLDNSSTVGGSGANFTGMRTTRRKVNKSALIHVP